MLQRMLWVTMLLALTAGAAWGTDDPVVVRTGGGTSANLANAYPLSVDRLTSTVTVRGDLVVTGSGGGTAASRWAAVSAAKYTSAPASSSQITMSDTSDLGVGRPVKYTYGASTTGYGIVVSMAANETVIVAGHCLNTTQSLTGLWVGTPEMVVQHDYFIAGMYGDGASLTLLASDQHTYSLWRQGAAHLVGAWAVHRVNDGTAQPKINLRLAGAAVWKTPLQVSPSWQPMSAVAVWPAVYSVAFGTAIEVECQTAGTAGNAQDLTVQAVFVLE